MKPTSVLVCNPKGDRSLQTVKSLEDMQEIVGGYIELISLPDFDVYVNEDGQTMNLDLNPAMTRLVKKELAKVGRVLMSVDGWILGTAILAGKCDRDGEMTDYPVLIDA